MTLHNTMEMKQDDDGGTTEGLRAVDVLLIVEGATLEAA